MLDALAAVAKAFVYLGVLTAAGGVFAHASLGASNLPDGCPERLVRHGAVLVIVAAASAALLLIFRLGGQFDEPTLSAVFISGTGAATTFQLVGALLLLTPAVDDAPRSPTRLSNAVLLTASFAIHGHAATDGVLSGALALIHVSAVAWWVGSLCLLRAACHGLDQQRVATLLQRFSGFALKVVAALAAAGLTLLIALVDLEDEPWRSPYGQVIAMKLVLVIVVLALAGYNRWRLTPRLLAGDRAAVSELRAMVDRELLLIGAILIVTAILTTYTWPEALGDE